jgi:hypothetical protein
LRIFSTTIHQCVIVFFCFHVLAAKTNFPANFEIFKEENITPSPTTHSTLPPAVPHAHRHNLPIPSQK